MWIRFGYTMNFGDQYNDEACVLPAKRKEGLYDMDGTRTMNLDSGHERATAFSDWASTYFLYIMLFFSRVPLGTGTEMADGISQLKSTTLCPIVCKRGTGLGLPIKEKRNS